MGEPLYHLVQKSVWSECVASQTPYYPVTYGQDGFIHLTKNPSLLVEVANHFYKDVKGEFIVLVLDETKLDSEVKYEGAADVGEKKTKRFGDHESEEQQIFPHLYGTINFSSVECELDVTRDADSGSFLSTAALIE